MIYPRIITIIAYRDLQRFWKYKWWLAGLVAMNLADLFIFALIFRGIVRRDIVPDYFFFLAPGIASISAFAAAFTIGREVMMELRRAFHHYLLSLPFSRLELVAGRVVSGIVRGFIYQIPFIILLIVIAKTPSFLDLLIVVSTTIMVTASMSSLSIAISTLVKSLEFQATIRSLVYFIIFFMSNVFYPESIIRLRFPEIIYIMVVNNPISIATTIYRDIFTPHVIHETYSIEVLIAKLAIWTAILVATGSILYMRNLQS
ncbi:MAG: ABC transporter permease [Acidilobaceae archaeon]